jgi:ubiquinone/menaquinone biosynthesis C-methylase UbiE
MPQRKFDQFDEFAEEYRLVHTENIKISGADSHYFAEMKVKWLAGFEKNDPLRILDLGCGDGATAYYFQQYFSSWKTCGIDISSKSIEVAKQRKLSNCDFRVYNGENIPYEEDYFDVVFVAGVFHHVDFSHHQQLAAEIFRVMKNDARLYLFEHNPLNPLTRYLVNTCVFDKDAKLLKSTYASALLKKAGFAAIRKKFIIFFPRKGWLSKLIFLEQFLERIPFGGQFVLMAKKQKEKVNLHQAKLFIQN